MSKYFTYGTSDRFPCGGGLANPFDLVVTRVQWFCPVPVSVILHPSVSDGDVHRKIFNSRWARAVVPPFDVCRRIVTYN